jgi:ribosomal protein L12E/L44/L45/RPP1/RPP2
MVFGLTVSLPAKWEQFLKRLADDHRIDLNAVVSELCEWSFSDAESKEQFKAWLDEAYPAEGEAEDESRGAGEEAAEEEEENEEESEEESHEHRD